MIGELMETVYGNLRLLMSCPVTRAWPARDALAPSLTFRLLSYEAGESGAGEATVEALIRAASPAQGDALSLEAEAAFQNIHCELRAAQDDSEGDGGVFLRRLTFLAPLFEGAIAPLELLVNANLPGVSALQGPFLAAQEPAEAPMLPRGPLSGPALLTPGRAGGGAIRITAAYRPEDPAREAVGAHFQNGTLMPCALARGSRAASFSAYVAQYANTPLGFQALLRISAS